MCSLKEIGSLLESGRLVQIEVSIRLRTGEGAVRRWSAADFEQMMELMHPDDLYIHSGDRHRLLADVLVDELEIGASRSLRLVFDPYRAARS